MLSHINGKRKVRQAPCRVWHKSGAVEKTCASPSVVVAGAVRCSPSLKPFQCDAGLRARHRPGALPRYLGGRGSSAGRAGSVVGTKPFWPCGAADDKGGLCPDFVPRSLPAGSACWAGRGIQRKAQPGRRKEKCAPCCATDGSAARSGRATRPPAPWAAGLAARPSRACAMLWPWSRSSIMRAVLYTSASFSATG